MEAYQLMSGGAPFVKKYRIDGGVTIAAGTVVTSDPTANNEGIINCTTVAALASMGLAIAGGVSQDAQNTDHSENAGEAAVIINPDLLIRAKLTQGATEDTALTVLTATAASTAGTTVPTVTDEYTIWGYSGANARMVRRATTSTTVTLAFPKDIAIGDEFLACQCVEGDVSHFPQLSTAFTQVNAAAAVDTDNDNFIPVELLLRDEAEDGRNNSYVILVAYANVFGCPGQIA